MRSSFGFTWIIGIVMALLVGCGEPLEESDLPPELGAAQPTAESAQPLTGCSAQNDCLSPYNGVPVTCTGTSSCSPTSNGVICDGVRRYCASPPPTTCEMNPSMTCTSGKQCNLLCGGPGVCQSSTACCFCY